MMRVARTSLYFWRNADRPSITLRTTSTVGSKQGAPNRAARRQVPPQPRWIHFYKIELRGDSRFATALPSLFPMRFILVQSLDGAANGRCLVQPRKVYLFILTPRRFLIFVREYRQTFYCSEDHLDWDPHRESQIELPGGRCLHSHIKLTFSKLLQLPGGSRLRSGVDFSLRFIGSL